MIFSGRSSSLWNYVSVVILGWWTLFSFCSNDSGRCFDSFLLVRNSFPSWQAKPFTQAVRNYCWFTVKDVILYMEYKNLVSRVRGRWSTRAAWPEWHSWDRCHRESSNSSMHIPKPLCFQWVLYYHNSWQTQEIQTHCSTVHKLAVSGKCNKLSTFLFSPSSPPAYTVWTLVTVPWKRVQSQHIRSEWPSLHLCLFPWYHTAFCSIFARIWWS